MESMLDVKQGTSYVVCSSVALGNIKELRKITPELEKVLLRKKKRYVLDMIY